MTVGSCHGSKTCKPCKQALLARQPLPRTPPIPPAAAPPRPFRARRAPPRARAASSLRASRHWQPRTAAADPTAPQLFMYGPKKLKKCLQFVWRGR